MNQEKVGSAFFAISGIGIGMLLASLSSGTYILLLGTGLVIISLVGLIILFYKNGKKQKK